MTPKRFIVCYYPPGRRQFAEDLLLLIKKEAKETCRIAMPVGFKLEVLNGYTQTKPTETKKD